VALKLAITAFATVILLVYMGTFREMAGVAADPVVELGLVRNPSPLVHALLALVLLVVATVLAIYKPFGLTPYGTRKLSRPQEVATQRGGVRPTGNPTWAYVIATIVFVVLLALALAHHLAGAAFKH
jgi:hypothetical protein